MLDWVSLYDELLCEALRRVEAGESRDFVTGELAAHLEKAFRNASEAGTTVARDLEIRPRPRDAEGLRREVSQRIDAGEDGETVVREYGEVLEDVLREVIAGDVKRQAMLRGNA